MAKQRSIASQLQLDKNCENQNSYPNGQHSCKILINSYPNGQHSCKFMDTISGLCGRIASRISTASRSGAVGSEPPQLNVNESTVSFASVAPAEQELPPVAPSGFGLERARDGGNILLEHYKK